ncbi:unnamed protein product [Enterobius vermicularis]|uniref:Uncharacterized protein n=1 Tax=Enterobius vermicularis TaxID=51028 RepID=A0A0N4VBI6_ENTVE|nr:unnamed protein product [Enterobius vermicularis]
MDGRQLSSKQTVSAASFAFFTEYKYRTKTIFDGSRNTAAVTDASEDDDDDDDDGDGAEAVNQRKMRIDVANSLLHYY